MYVSLFCGFLLGLGGHGSVSVFVFVYADMMVFKC